MEMEVVKKPHPPNCEFKKICGTCKQTEKCVTGVCVDNKCKEEGKACANNSDCCGVGLYCDNDYVCKKCEDGSNGPNCGMKDSDCGNSDLVMDIGGNCVCKSCLDYVGKDVPNICKQYDKDTYKGECSKRILIPGKPCVLRIKDYDTGKPCPAGIDQDRPVCNDQDENQSMCMYGYCSRDKEGEIQGTCAAVDGCCGRGVMSPGGKCVCPSCLVTMQETGKSPDDCAEIPSSVTDPSKYCEENQAATGSYCSLKNLRYTDKDGNKQFCPGGWHPEFPECVEQTGAPYCASGICSRDSRDSFDGTCG